MKRRELLNSFVKLSTLTVFGAYLSACDKQALAEIQKGDGGSGTGLNGGDPGLCIDTAGVNNNNGISANHGHTVSVSLEDIDNGTTEFALTLGNNHIHSLTLIAQNIADLRDNGTVIVESGRTGHTHNVTITCS